VQFGFGKAKPAKLASVQLPDERPDSKCAVSPAPFDGTSPGLETGVKVHLALD
jgi:hypothetical protein